MKVAKTGLQRRRRPSKPEWAMMLAMTVRQRADCMGSLVGAVLMRDGNLISEGYNGTPANMPNCTDGGCYRCQNSDKYELGTGYDLCICVHAEQNALLSAAKFGNAVEGSDLYTTMSPCFGCMKELWQAGVQTIYYHTLWQPRNRDLLVQWEALKNRFPGGWQAVAIADPGSAWAMSPRRVDQTPPHTGHSGP